MRRLSVGRKLTLLVLLPVTCLLTFIAFGAVARWEEAGRLRAFRTATEVAFSVTEVSDAVAQERTAAVEARLRPGTRTRAEREEAERATRQALAGAEHRAASWTGTDVTGGLRAVSRRLRALRALTESGALTAPATAQRYSTSTRSLLDAVARLESGRPTRESGRAADAHLALLRAVEAAERERVELAVLLDEGPGPLPASARRWSALEDAELDTFRRNTTTALGDALHGIRSRAPGRAVSQVRALLDAADPSTLTWPSYDTWLAVSGARVDSLRDLQDRAARRLADVAADDARGARSRAVRDLTLSLTVLTAFTALALAVRRSVVRPLGEVAVAARAVSRGDLAYDIRHRGRDELGDVAGAFRELRGTAERLAGELRAMTAAIDADRPDHRADVTAYAGTWARLADGVNGAMTSFAAAQGRRRKDERDLEGIFNLSLDLLCICGLDGYFKRVNPAFERTLGHPAETLLARPYLEFVHEADRDATRTALDRLARGEALAGFENRFVREDGTERWLQWSARPVPEVGLFYAAARDVTESRRTTREQAALRRVATLVARGAPAAEVFQRVATEVGDLLGTRAAVLRHDPDGGDTLLGTSRGLPEAVEWATREARRGAGRKAVEEVARTGRAAHVGHAVAVPVVVEDRLWAIVVATSVLEELPAGTESRLADFTELAATAIANTDSRAQLTASRARVVAASDASRRRIERDLHDGVQQRLVALQLELKLAESLLTDPPRELAEQIAHIGEGLGDAFQDLLEVARGIHPAILSRGGLGPALRSLARRSAVPVELDLELPGGRLPERLEVAAYYVVSECLNNAAKHAHAHVVEVGARIRDGRLEMVIADDGVGGADTGRGSGLIGLIDRVEASGGRLDISSPPGAGTTLRAVLPLDVPHPYA
ncbi:PAS domain S-box protein [Streptomyces sp. NPDC090106]|uniref:PAS domain S-box protein n=1 Tax=Streptomyces sp. NPDC090106 TaxID=3365946 RepID=UPI003821122D